MPWRSSGSTCSRSADPRNFGRPAGWINLLLGIQSFGLLVFGTTRIGSAIRTDVTTRMIESHRLMPTPAPQAIAGYLVGGGSQALLTFVTTFFIGAILSVTAGLATDRWILSNGILLLFAFFVWTIVALASFVTSKSAGAMGWMIGFFAITSALRGLVTAFLPALTILCSPIMGDSIFIAPGGGAAPTLGYGALLVAQIVVGSLFFFAAARRYRSADATGFTPATALALVAAWVAITLFAMRNWEKFSRRSFDRSAATSSCRRSRRSCRSPRRCCCACCRWRRARDSARLESPPRANDPGLGRRPIHPCAATLICAGLCMAITMGVREPTIAPLGKDFLLQRLNVSAPLAAVVTTAAVLLACLFSCSYLFQIVHRGNGRRGAVLVGMFIVITWIAPLAVEVRVTCCAMTISSSGRASRGSVRSAPILAWTPAGADPAPGLLVQLGIAAILALMFHLTGGRGAPLDTG